MALDALPASQRLAISLRYLDGLSVPEIAAAISKSVHAVESLSRAAAQPSNSTIWSTVMSERDPFETLRDLIGEPVKPREAFADELRSRLMREMSASEHSRKSRDPNGHCIRATPARGIPNRTRAPRSPTAILELAAVGLIILGLVAALNRGWFQSDPEPPTLVPAAALQGDSASTPETEPEQTAPPQTATPAQNNMEPTVVPPGNIPNTIWALPLPEGESLDFGGMLVDDDTVYRLLATSSFVGVQAVDAERRGQWQQAHSSAGNLFQIEDDVLYFDGGDNTLVAVNAETGAEMWRATINGNPIALEEDDDDRIFVLLDTDFVTALNGATGEELWVAQGQVPQNPSGGSASNPATGKIAVEDNVVAAISTYGVLTGFDGATGEERWSRDGYDAALVTILAEDDVFVVSEGYSGFGTGIGAAAGGSPDSDSQESGPAQSGSQILIVRYRAPRKAQPYQ